ncbi:hypothetical protein C7S18_18800 [Ahniella affigens]|uniref:Conjugal transfer protein TraB n=1 Tax=Ahniella affigens TaxID=2021234 RepID=A0A2P1PW73_9GAMM|nr:TraB/VirB10 family protein [Ahniella affigens]AVP99090.1 hypothetical protein C7S18_18800 [Ahniella affigens]
MIKALRRRFTDATPERKRLMMIVGVIGVAAISAIILAPEKRVRPETKLPPIDNVLTSADPKELGLSAIARELDLLKRQLADAKQTKGASPSAAPIAAPDPELLALREELSLMREELKVLRKRPTTISAGQDRSITPIPATQNASSNLPLPPPPAFQTIEADLDPAEPAPAETERVAYLPAGTLVSGKLLYGLDASTASAAIRNPQPVVIRIKHDAILPNRVRFDVRECFLTAAGYGELSSERVMLRAENLSCVRTDGRVLDVKLQAIAVGEDGKVGLRGRLVSKQGRVVGLAALAGLAEGASQALGRSTTYVTPGANGDALSAAGGRGVSSSLDRVAEFYLDKADQLSPILEVASSRDVTFALVSGVRLNLLDADRQSGG